MERRTTFQKHDTQRTEFTSFTKAMDGANALKLKQKPDPPKTWKDGGQPAPSSTSMAEDLPEHETNLPLQNFMAAVPKHSSRGVA